VTATTTRLGRHAARERNWPATGPQLLADAARYATGAARDRDMTARRAVLAVLLGVDDDRHIECLTVTQGWFDRVHGYESWAEMTGEDAATTLARIARDLEVALERADGDAPIGGRALMRDRLTQTELLDLETELAIGGGPR
jgi:hypothetical protein